MYDSGHKVTTNSRYSKDNVAIFSSPYRFSATDAPTVFHVDIHARTQPHNRGEHEGVRKWGYPRRLLRISSQAVDDILAGRWRYPRRPLTISSLFCTPILGSFPCSKCEKAMISWLVFGHTAENTFILALKRVKTWQKSRKILLAYKFLSKRYCRFSYNAYLCSRNYNTNTRYARQTAIIKMSGRICNTNKKRK